MKSHVVSSWTPIREGDLVIAECGTAIGRVSFGAMGDLRSFAEIQDAVNCYRCKKAKDPKRKLYYGASEAQEAMLHRED